MGLFKRETPHEKRLRKLREKDLNAIYEKAKFEAQKEAAEREGRKDGLKGRNKRTIMDRLNAAGKEFSKQVKIMEEIIGDPPHMTIMDETMSQQVVAKPKKRGKTKQIVIVEEKKEKPKSLFDQMMEI